MHRLGYTRKHTGCRWIFSYAGFSLGPIFPTTIALMPELLPDRIVATAIGFLASFAAAGSALMPWLAGNLAQRIGLWTLMPFVMALALADLGIWLFLERRSNRTDKNLVS